MQPLFGKLTGTPQYGYAPAKGTTITAYGQSPLGEKTRYEGAISLGTLSVQASGDRGNASISVPLSNMDRLSRWTMGFFGKRPAQFEDLRLEGEKPTKSTRQALVDDVFELRDYIEAQPPEGGFKDPERRYISQPKPCDEPPYMGPFGPMGRPWGRYPFDRNC